jgi:hypothetical protein
MKVYLEIAVEPVAGGPVARFTRLVSWETVPRIDDDVELIRGFMVFCPVENVIFQANGTVRVILAVYEEDDAERVAAILRGEKSRWIEDKGS